MPMPMEGYRVLDMTTWYQSVAGRMLGDLGAEVIKIEPRVTGDPMRGVIEIQKMETGEARRNVAFEHGNYNKKSITLDLRKEKGREILYKLVEKSDVFLHNLRREPASRLGLDYDTLSQYNPRLVYTVSSGWGSKGPDINRASYDRLAQARSGIMSLAGQPETPPSYINAAIADHMGATVTTLAWLSLS
ncbi:MAG: CoA transferase [Dehalococcoidia bacterium]